MSGCIIIDGKSATAAALDALDWKNSARIATAAVLPASTLANNRLTADANGAFPVVDGIALALLESILVKDEVAGVDNGLYIIIDLGDGGTPWILQRRDDANTSEEVTTGMTVPIEEGTANADTAWTLTTIMPIVLNTTALVFQDILSGAATLQAVLAVGNTTGGTNIEVTGGDSIVSAAGTDLTLAPAGGQDVIVTLDLRVGNAALNVNGGLTVIGTSGFINVSDNETNATDKIVRFATNHFTNAEEPVSAFLLQSAVGDNTLTLGGGTGMNACTVLRFFTAANNTTVTGTEQGSFDAAGDFHALNAALISGATEVEAPAGADEIVLGTLSLGASFGITVLTGTDAIGMVNMTDVSGAVRGAWSYDHDNVRHVWAAEGGDEMFLTTVALSPAADAGNSLGTDPLRWLEGFIDQVLVAGAVATDADASADDEVIGDGSAVDRGMTFVGTSTSDMSIAYSDGTLLRRGEIRLENSATPDRWVFRIANVDRMSLDTTFFGPITTLALDIGATGQRWGQAFVEGPVWGVEASAAAITAADERVIIISADGGTGAVTVTLPAAAPGLDYILIVLDITNAVNIVRAAGDTINGAGANPNIGAGGPGGSGVGRYYLTALDATDWRLHGPVAEV